MLIAIRPIEGASLRVHYPASLDFFNGYVLTGGIVSNRTGRAGLAWTHVKNQSYALLRNVRRGLIDPDTATSAKTMKSTFDGSTLNLRFSNEFNKDNRTIYPGDNPFWTGANIWYGATQGIE